MSWCVVSRAAQPVENGHEAFYVCTCYAERLVDASSTSDELHDGDRQGEFPKMGSPFYAPNIT